MSRPVELLNRSVPLTILSSWLKAGDSVSYMPAVVVVECSAVCHDQHRSRVRLQCLGQRRKSCHFGHSVRRENHVAPAQSGLVAHDRVPTVQRLIWLKQPSLDI
jgi:hypothetical protein